MARLGRISGPISPQARRGDRSGVQTLPDRSSQGTAWRDDDGGGGEHFIREVYLANAQRGSRAAGRRGSGCTPMPGSDSTRFSASGGRQFGN